MLVRTFECLNYTDSQTSSCGCEIPSGAKGASLPKLLLRAGTIHPTAAAAGSNGTEGERPAEPVRALPQGSGRTRLPDCPKKPSDARILCCDSRCSAGSTWQAQAAVWSMRNNSRPSSLLLEIRNRMDVIAVVAARYRQNRCVEMRLNLMSLWFFTVL